MKTNGPKDSVRVAHDFIQVVYKPLTGLRASQRVLLASRLLVTTPPLHSLIWSSLSADPAGSGFSAAAR